jgi:hypothetical protein
MATLHFAAGKLVRAMVATVTQTDFLHQLIDAMVGRVARRTRQAHVFCDGESRYQPKMLKDKTDVRGECVRSCCSPCSTGAQELKCSDVGASCSRRN